MAVIPCIQTLAHLNAFVRWDKVKRDYDDILLADDERTYELIDHMFATLSECFASRKIHIGMDEAHMLGRGKHFDIHGYETVNNIMKRHLARVCDIADKYGYEVMLWSDMYFRPWNDGKYSIPKCEMPKEIVDTHVRWGKLSRNIYCLSIEVHSCSVSKNTSVHIIWDWKRCPGNPLP